MSNFIYDSNFNGPEGVPFIGEANKYHYVYLIVNHLNGKIYIGVHSTKKLNDRYIGSSKSVKNDIKEFGIKWFTKYNLFYFYTRKEAFTKEYELVDKEFCLRNDTYNIAIGGKGLYLAVVPYETRKKMSEANKGRKHTDETKKKMSETKKGHVVTDETKKKISEANKGRKLTDELKQKMSETRKGRKLTESTRKKMSESRKGRIVTEETRKKISKANKGRKMTDEMRRKKSEIMKGRVSGHKGHKHTDETKKKMSEAKKGKKSPACKIIVKCDMDGNIITEFPSVKSAILDSNKSQRFFYKRLKMQEPINGFIYKYKEQEQQDSENIIQE